MRLSNDSGSSRVLHGASNFNGSELKMGCALPITMQRNIYAVPMNRLYHAGQRTVRDNWYPLYSVLNVS